MILATFTNAEYGIESRVALRNAGDYAVTIRDIDANDVVPVAMIYATEARAIAEAQRLVA